MAPPPPAPNFQPSVPEIANPQYGSGKYGSGVFGTLRDLWDQAQNPYFAQEEIMGFGGGATPPPGAGPAPALPPGYVSTNAPGSETPSTSTGAGGGSGAGRPALPPGYYPIDGPPPPGYYAPPPAPITPIPLPPSP